MSLLGTPSGAAGAEAASLEAVSITFAYHEAEDRLVLLAFNKAGESQALLLTRRMTARLVNGLAKILERTSLVASKAPADMREDVIMLEHQGALQEAAPAGDPVGASRTPPSTPPRLLAKIDLKTLPSSFTVAFSDQKVQVAHMSVSRAELHRILEMLTRQAAKADWAVAIDAAWLDPSNQSVVFN